MNKNGEPPSSNGGASLFRIGKDSHGRWVVQDQNGLCGGLFVGRAEALKYAMFENGNQPQAVVMVPGVLELDMHAKPLPRPSNSDTSLRPWHSPRVADAGPSSSSISCCLRPNAYPLEPRQHLVPEQRQLVQVIHH